LARQASNSASTRSRSGRVERIGDLPRSVYELEPPAVTQSCRKDTPYLRYDTYLAAGLPIATGVIEGACRHLVKDRMDITGARWSLQGAEAVLRLRALRSSGDFDAYWSFHEAQEFRRNHAANYAAGRVVPVQGRKPNLRRLK